jgi:hypothetical protein
VEEGATEQSNLPAAGSSALSPFDIPAARRRGYSDDIETPVAQFREQRSLTRQRFAALGYVQRSNFIEKRATNQTSSSRYTGKTRGFGKFFACNQSNSACVQT